MTRSNAVSVFLSIGAVAAAAACTGGEPVAGPSLGAVASPMAIACTAGETATLRVAVSGGAGGASTVSFVARNENVAVAASGSDAAVRCAVPGSSVVDYRVTSGRETVTGSVPVTIAEPPPLAVTLTPDAIACEAGDSVAVRRPPPGSRRRS